MSNLIRLESIPNLDDFVPASADLSGEYWTPEEGDVRRLVFMGIKKQMAPSHSNPDESIELDCAVFVEPEEGGGFATVINGSKRLVAAFENTSLPEGTPVQVKYLGKKRNRTNSHHSDFWSVILLKAPGEAN